MNRQKALTQYHVMIPIDREKIGLPRASTNKFDQQRYRLVIPQLRDTV